VARKSPTTMKIVSRLEDIPKFKSEREESDFWASHELSDDLWSKAEPLPEGILPPARPRTRPVAIRFDESTIGRLKRLAARLHKGYQSLLKEFVVERLYEEEKREGLIPASRPPEAPHSAPGRHQDSQRADKSTRRRPPRPRKAGQ